MIAQQSLASRQGSTGNLEALLRVALCACLLFLLAWPLTHSMSAAVDDIVRLIPPTRHIPLSTAIADEWHTKVFRPLNVLFGYLVDPISRDARLVLLLHLPALVATLLGLSRAARILGLGSTASLAAAVMWCLSPGTTVALWQPDTVSQTWSAAAGVWLAIMLISIAKSSTQMRRVFICFLIAVIGLLSKETFIGWVFASLVLVAATEGRMGRGTMTALAVVVITVGYVVLRVSTGGLLSAVDGSDSGRYSIHGAGAIAMAAMAAVAGLFVQGPVQDLAPHAAVPLLARLLPVVGTLAFALVCLLPCVSRAPRDARVAWLRAIWLFPLAFAILIPVLPTGQMSELYLFGPNVCVTLIFGASVELLSATSPQGVVGRAALGTAITIAFLGLVSRAHDFSVTWNYSNTLSRRAFGLVHEIAPRDIRVPLAADCAGGSLYSVYVVPPIAALNVPGTLLLLQAMSAATSQGETASADVGRRQKAVIDCSSLPKRWNW